MGRKEGGKQNTKDFRLPVNTGVRSDTFAEDVPLLDINNYVLKPDGSAIKPREGYIITRSFASIGGVNRPRKTIFFIPDPPEIDGGDLVMISAWRGGQQAIEASEIVQAATLPPENDGYVESIFRISLGETDYITMNTIDPPDMQVRILRGGDIFGESTIKVKTIDGTALAGVDYTAVDQTVTFAYGENEKYVPITVEAASAGNDKEFQVQLYAPSEGSVKITDDAGNDPSDAKLEML